MTETIFSHRPAAGVSVAATNEGSRLLVAVSLVNDGTSRNGILWPERRDSFSRAKARQILLGRLEAARSNPNANVPMTFTFDTDMTARQFIAGLRPRFKPTADESDATFCAVADEFGVEVRYRDSASEIFEKTANMINEVVADAGSRI